MDRQALFDTVGKHLLTQGRQALEDLGEEVSDLSCRYRLPLPTGYVLKCGIGALIPDEMYRPWMEGLGVNGLLSPKIVDNQATREERLEMAGRLMKLWGVGDGSPILDDLRFLTKLQEIHDNGYPNQWRVRLAEFAEEEGLNPEAILP